MTTSSNTPTTRRDFLKASAVVGGMLAAPAILPGTLFAAENQGPLKVGLVGCGGRGSGAAAQALAADKGAVLTAMADAFEDKLQASLQSLREKSPEQVKVTPDKCFVGLDAYQKVIDSGVDVVLLCTPPGFRPTHFKAAVDAGKHIFCEKPVATDVAGVRSVMESVKVAKQKSISLVAGFCWRYEDGRREFYKRVHDGFIGDVRAVYATYYTGPVKPMPAVSTRPADMGDLAWQMRNWYNFVWLCGDGYVEQAVHSVDKVAWAMKDQPPISAVAVGGRQTPNNEGDIYDHMFVVYDYPGNVKGFVGQRQIAHTFSENADYLIGSAGFGRIPGLALQGKESWRYVGDKGDMYQNEHNELFASIRCGKPINDGDRMAASTLLAIMGRMAAYTGQRVTWEEILQSKEKLVPDKLSWDMKLEIAPMAVPGSTRLI